MSDMYGTEGDDVLTPTDFNTTRIFGLGGNDILTSGPRGVELRGGPGNDVYHLNHTSWVYEQADEGYDIVYTQLNNFAILAGQSIEEIRWYDPRSTYRVTIRGNEYAQIIAGNDGDGEFLGNGGGDTYIGYAGNDDYYVGNSDIHIIEGVNGGSRDSVYTNVSYRLPQGQEIEVLTATVPGGVGYASATGPIDLFGNEFAQVINGNAYANILSGGGGADTLIGNGGNDTYWITDARAAIWERGSADYDTVYASVSYRLVDGESIEALLTDDASSNAPLRLDGNNYAQVIAGNAGANILTGGGGADTLIGRGGNDTYGISDSSAVVWEDVGGGTDVIYTTVNYSLERTREIEGLFADDAASTTRLYLGGNEFSQVIAGNTGDNILAGGILGTAGGTDTLIGRGGNDIYIVNDSSARVWEATGEGSDVVHSTVSFALEATREIEGLYAYDAASTDAIALTGNEFAQVIAGNAGANTLNGGAGADTLVGRGGSDGFAFTTTLGGSNIDWLFDFDSADDTILLDDAVFAGLAPGALLADAFVVGTAAADANDRIIYDAAAGRLWFDADGSGPGAAVQFATLGTGLALTAADIWVI